MHDGPREATAKTARTAELETVDMEMTNEPDALTAPTVELEGRPAPTGLHARLLDRLGLAICGGDLATGSVVRIDQLQERYGVSRSVVREAIRVLASMGLVTPRRRVGVQVLAAVRWKHHGPHVRRDELPVGAELDRRRARGRPLTRCSPAWVYA